MEPFKPESVSADKPPSQWKDKHKYGGKRFPIRLEVFLHAKSAHDEQLSTTDSGSQGGNGRFCDYKKAHNLPFGHKQWLHPEEVLLVKLVLLRFAKSQLNAKGLKKAFEDAGLPCPPTGKKQDALAKRIVKALAAGLHEKDGPSATCTVFEEVVKTLKDNNTATEEQLEAIMDHYHKKFAKKDFFKCEFIGVRAYR